MKKIISIIFILSTSACTASNLDIQGTSIQLTDSCEIKATYKNKPAEAFKLNLPNASSCSFITHSNTNIVHLEQVTNAYMFLVESTETSENNCKSTYIAVAVSNVGDISISPISKRSGSCGAGRERKVFEYFAFKMKILK